MRKWTAKGMSCVPFRSCNQHVEFVDKRHQSLATIPDETFRYSRTLEELLLDANHIRELPKQLMNLTRLRKLCLSDNEIKELPQNLGNLANLAELDVSRNEIQIIPTSIRSLTRLRQLDLSSNPITSLPASFCDLKSLTILTLNDTALTELPDAFGNCSSLISVELRENALRSLPQSFENLRNLERLDLGDNELSDLPAFIGQLTKLTELWLDHNLLFRLPKEIGHLEKLVCFDVSENQLDELPDEIGNLRNLTDFIASQNNIDRLPQTVGSLSSLVVLKLEQNKLNKVHPNLALCTKLQELFLRENLLDELGDWIGRLENLKILNMDCNRITTVTEKVANLGELGVLSLRMNLLERLPDEVGSCVKLMVIDVSGNRLQNLPFTIASLPLLKAVWLSENQSQAMPNFNVDYVFNEPILTCYLLPQIGAEPLNPQDGLPSTANGVMRNAVGLPKLSPTDVDITARNTTVKFDDGSDDESSVNGAESESTGFVRHNTPHPRDLKAKFQKWFGGSKPKSKTVDKVFVASDENENSKGPFRPERQKIDVNEPYSQLHGHKQAHEVEKAKIEENRTDSSEQDDTETDDQGLTGDEKHVEFIVEQEEPDDDDEPGEERLNLRLQRRDTPHHLKNKRINPADADAEALQAILQKVPSPSPPKRMQNDEPINSPFETEDSIDSNSMKRPTTVELELVLNREGGQPFGLNIAGGLGSSPFVDNDQSIFVSKVVPGGLADGAGLKAGDRVTQINGIDFTNIEHRTAVDTIRKAGNRIVFVVERKVLGGNYPGPQGAELGEPRSVSWNGTTATTASNNDDFPNSNPSPSPSPNLVFPCPKPYKAMPNFDAMIPSEVKNPSAVVTVTIKQPDTVSSRVPDIFPPAPTDLGTVTEVITKSTLTETVFTRVTHNEPVMAPVTTDMIYIEKTSEESLGVKIISGSEEACFPFSFPNQPGVYVVYVTKDGPAARAGLKIGHRILEINGQMVDPTDKNKIAIFLLQAGNKVDLRVRKHGPPPGFMPIEFNRDEKEPLGMHIKGGTDNPGNPLNKDDTGIFISKILPNGAVHRNALSRVGMRILCVNGNPLLNITHNDAVNVFRMVRSDIEMLLANGYDPKEVEQLRSEGKLPDKIVEILSNSEEAAAAISQYSNEAEPSAKQSVDKVMEVVKAAEQLVVPSSPTPPKEKSVVVPGSPGPVHDMKKTTIVMSGHSKTSPGLGGSKKFFTADNENQLGSSEHLEPKPRTPHHPPTYANLNDLHAGSSDDVEFIDDESNDELRKSNGDLIHGVGVEARNPIFNGADQEKRKMIPPMNLNLQHNTSNSSSGAADPNNPPPVPTPRTSLGSYGSGRLSPEEQPKELKVKIKQLPPSKSFSISPIPHHIPLAPTEEFDPADTEESVFQFSPEFHRVPSPMLNRPHLTYIHTEDSHNKFHKEDQPVESNNDDIIPQGELEDSEEEQEEGVQSKEESSKPPSPPPTGPIVTGQGSRSNIVSARAKFFEQEIQHHQAAPAKSSNKQFSFLSPYEIDRMKQEEDNKIAAAAATMSQIEYLRSGELEQVVEEEEEYGDDDELMMGGNQQGGGEQEGKEQGSQSGAETASGGESGFPSERASGHVRSISASSVSSVSSTSSVRTAKAERRLKERLSQEGLFPSDVITSSDMSPSEQRALQAEKRAAWRQARLKSLEQDALQAQMVLNRISEIIDSPPPVTNANQSSTLQRKLDNVSEDNPEFPDEENNISINKPTKLGSPSTTNTRYSHSSSSTSAVSNQSESQLPNVRFPSLFIRHRSSGPKKIIGQRERLLGEKISRKTEEWLNEETGAVEIRTVEIVEKIIEHEVETTEQKIISIELDGPLSPTSPTSTDDGNTSFPLPTGTGITTGSARKKKRKNSKKK
ncbi:protein scribble homolog isoform X3 [Folsomia candida]|uniref:protein scribble homolog isoform X3 n=1 Tax=Folsomia candida TaxID=158441 RepID=UPI001605084D|nr:protein scribble homolog isoform X3 [Folsomia candida]